MGRKRGERDGGPTGTPLQQVMKYVLGQANNIQGFGLLRQSSGNNNLAISPRIGQNASIFFIGALQKLARQKRER